MFNLMKRAFFAYMALQSEGYSKVSQKGMASVNALLGIAMVAAVIFIVLANLWPTMQTANTSIQASTATDAGTTTSKTIFNLLLWIIPLGIGLALILRLVKTGK
jgi:hypothetical protein